MHLDNGILMRGKQVVLPNNLRYEVTREFHMQTGHQGEAHTVHGKLLPATICGRECGVNVEFFANIANVVW